MAGNDNVDFCLVVRSDSVHRIQESQDALVYELWSQVQRHLSAQPGGAERATWEGSSL
jgi:D-sedoheptulose 7-phosphate isomerase